MAGVDLSAIPQLKETASLREHLGIAVVTMVAGYGLSLYTRNILFWLTFTIGTVGVLFTMGTLWRLALAAVDRSCTLLRVQQATLAVCGVAMVIIATEGFLAWRERGAGTTALHSTGASAVEHSADELSLVNTFHIQLKPEAASNIERRRGVLTMPEEWARKPLIIPGSTLSFLWQGALHVHDEHYFRRTTPFPAKRPDTLRLLAVGDSMTYGFGVDEKFIYTTLLQEALNQEFRLEVLNLGQSGAQSEDILGTMRKFIPELQPDLIFYGVVHNDFLPSQKGQYAARGLVVPLPEFVKQYFAEHSRFVRFLTDGYDAMLRAAGVRQDFFEDILEDFGGYQKRFASDVAAMNAGVTERGLPPMLAMVLDQFPAVDGRGYRITEAAEHYLQAAGMDVIDTEDYYRRYNGWRFRVSLWEGHADELAHAIFASMITERLRRHPALQPFRKQPGE